MELIAITNKMQLSNGILLFQSTLIVNTINVLWNNKIPLLSCILLVIATSHTTMHGSMNIKFIVEVMGNT